MKGVKGFKGDFGYRGMKGEHGAKGRMVIFLLVIFSNSNCDFL